MSSYSSRQLPRDGIATGILGWPGTSYHAIRYEPLCGTLGTDDSFVKRYSSPFALSHCATAMDAYSNNTVDALGFYDEAGVKINGAIAGAGVDLCMCFSLKNSGGAAADVCWWIDQAGMEQVVWDRRLDYIVAGAFRPGSGKSIPHCADVNITALQASWSATAPQPTATGPVANFTQPGSAPTSTSSGPKGGSNNTPSIVGTLVGIVVSLIILGVVIQQFKKRSKARAEFSSAPITKPVPQEFMNVPYLGMARVPVTR